MSYSLPVRMKKGEPPNRSLKYGAVPSPPKAPPEPLPIGVIFERPQPLPPATPSLVDWTGGLEEWGVMHNDTVGNCVLACMAHMIAAWSGATGNRYLPTDQEVLDSYIRCVNYNPVTGANDTGMMITVGLDYLRNTGFGGHTCTGYEQVADVGRFLDSSLLYEAIFQFGGAIVSLALPSSAGDIFWEGEPWQGNMGAGVNHHCVPIISFDSGYFECITWGGLQRLDLAFLKLYCSEVYAAAGKDWVGANGRTPVGRTQNELMSDLAWNMVISQLAV